MDEGGSHRDNGRHKPDQYKAAQSQHQPSMKQIMAIMAERDAAVQERNLALSERKTAITERDMAFLQRDTAIAERNNAVLERDNAITTLQYRETPMTSGNNSMSVCPPGCQIARGVKHIHHPQQQHTHNGSHMNETDYSGLPLSPGSSEGPKSQRGKRTKLPKAPKAPKPPRKAKRDSEDLSKMIVIKQQHEWKDEDDNRQSVVSKSGWKEQDLGLNQVVYDETTMPAPVCSCTGVYRQCYKWGNGGWQSSCCTTTMSEYPLPSLPNKRHARIGGRKMSGSAYNKLLSRLAAEGHDLSNPIDLKENWAKHGTNRYITIK
ncbi:hypothetical protein ACFE04_012102 [Oxalis oulophora]